MDAGHVSTVSGYFTRLAEREPDWAAAGAVIAEMIEEAGGVSEEARAWAGASLGLDEEPRPGHDDDTRPRPWGAHRS